jgi:hypothetical protein
MSSGFNTDVPVGGQLFHVQTEDRGPSHPFIDTVVYQDGHVVHRRSSSYDHLELSVELGEDALRRRVEQQHRDVIEELRSGTLASEVAAAAEKATSAGGIQVQLLNPGSWLTAGNVTLDVKILRRADQQAQSGAHVEAAIEGALSDARHIGTSDHDGRVHIEFPLPPLGKGELALVILARADAGRDELRFMMRSKHKAPPTNSQK